MRRTGTTPYADTAAVARRAGATRPIGAALALLALVALVAASAAGLAACSTGQEPPAAAPSAAGSPVSGEVIVLPPPSTSGSDEESLSVEEAIAERRSVREFADRPLSLDKLSQLLWSAQGVTDPDAGYRAAPSAGALYPLTVYAAAHRVDGLDPGVYRYLPERNALELRAEGSVRARLFEGALSQPAVEQAPATLAFAADFGRTAAKYGERGRRYVYMEVGHAAENVYLQAAALGLGTVAIGAFEDEAVKSTLRLRDDEEPLYLMPVGEPRGE